MRTIRIIGTPIDGKHVNFLPFGIHLLADGDVPTSDTPGDWVNFSGSTDFRYLCVEQSQLATFFGRIRKYRTTLEVVGSYVTGAGTQPLHIGPSVTNVDVVKPAHDPDERFLPHGLSYYKQVSVDPITDGTLQYGFEFETSNSNQIMDPTNAVVPQNIFDIDHYFTSDTVHPQVFYSAVLDAFYIWPFVVCSLFFQYNLSGGYNMGWQRGPIPADLGTVVIDGTEVPYVSLGTASAVVTGFPDMTGYLYAPDGYGTIDTFTLTVSPPPTGGWFGFRDSDGNNPVWDEDDGSQLIFPVPMTMP